MPCTCSSTRMQRLRRFENAFADCVDCRCCEIHALNRPTALAPWPEVDDSFRQRTTRATSLGELSCGARARAGTMRARSVARCLGWLSAHSCNLFLHFKSRIFTVFVTRMNYDQPMHWA